MLGVIPRNVFLQISWWRLLLAGKIAWCSEYDICFYFSFFSECFAVTAELNNGSIISLKECYTKRNDQDICGYTTACNRTENMTGAVSPFKRCEAKCCSTEYCNKYLVPDLIPLHSHTQLAQHQQVLLWRQLTPQKRAPPKLLNLAASTLKLSVFSQSFCFLESKWQFKHLIYKSAARWTYY